MHADFLLSQMRHSYEEFGDYEYEERKPKGRL